MIFRHINLAFVPESFSLFCYVLFTHLQFEYLGDTSLFDDEDTRQFYENIPDLKAVIPGASYFLTDLPYS